VTTISISQVIEIGRDTLYTALLLALPALGVSLAVGLLISILQVITSIQEQTLSFVPRIVAVGIVLVFTMAWSTQVAAQFTVRLFSRLAEVTR
jgi:flagellar biosynthetic protein FliQ